MSSLTNKSLYHTTAQYYHLTDGDKSDDLTFYLDLARRYGGPILDYGCGSGRVSKALARAGYGVFAVDASDALLEIMQTDLESEPISLRRHIKFISIGAISTIPQIALCILAYNTFNEIIDTAEQEALLKTLSNLIRPSGILALEILPQFDYWPYLRLERSIKLANNQGTLLAYIQFQPDADKDLFLTICIFERLSPSGDIVEKVIGETVRRQISTKALTKLLNRTGFEVRSTFRSYDRSQQGNKCLLLARPTLR